MILPKIKYTAPMTKAASMMYVKLPTKNAPISELSPPPVEKIVWPANSKLASALEASIFIFTSGPISSTAPNRVATNPTNTAIFHFPFKTSLAILLKSSANLMTHPLFL